MLNEEVFIIWRARSIYFPQTHAFCLNYFSDDSILRNSESKNLEFAVLIQVAAIVFQHLKTRRKIHFVRITSKFDTSLRISPKSIGKWSILVLITGPSGPLFCLPHIRWKKFFLFSSSMKKNIYFILEIIPTSSSKNFAAVLKVIN